MNEELIAYRGQRADKTLSDSVNKGVKMEKIEIDEIIRELTKETKGVFGNKFRELILFGSYSRGDFDEWSDIDIMILVDINRNELVSYESKIVDISTAIGVKYNKLVAVVVQNYQFFEHWVNYLPFYENVRKEGIQCYVAA